MLLPGAPPENAIVVVRKLMDGLREACGRDIPVHEPRPRVCQSGAGQLAAAGLRGPSRRRDGGMR